MTPTQVGIKLNDTTSANELDSFFTRVWSQDRRVKIVFDATDCRKISVGRILSMKGVLDEHRYSSRQVYRPYGYLGQFEICTIYITRRFGDH